MVIDSLPRNSIFSNANFTSPRPSKIESWRKNRDFESKANVRLDEIFHGITDIKLNEAEKSERNKFFDILKVTHKVRLRLEAGMAGIPAMIDIIVPIGFLAVMIFGAIDITSGSKTIGEFL